MASLRVIGGDIGFALVEPEEEMPSLDVNAGRLDPSDAHALAIERARLARDRGADLVDIASIEAIIFGHRRRPP